jgi:hypothetical protein
MTARHVSSASTGLAARRLLRIVGGYERGRGNRGFPRYFNWRPAVLNQRIGPGGVPVQKPKEFVRWQQSADHLFSRLNQ